MVTSKRIAQVALGLLVGAPLAGLYAWAVTGFGGPEGSTRAGVYVTLVMCGLALLVAGFGAMAWVVTIGVRGARSG